MNKYEILYIINNGTTDEAKQAIVDKFAALVTTLGGSVVNIDKWGTKKFAYTIDNNKTEGYYVLMNVVANADAPAEIDRQMRNTDEILRQMIVRK